MKMNFTQLELYRIESEFENFPHRHEQQFQVTVPIRGTCYFTHENKERILTAGEGLILQPNDKHSLHLGADAGIIILKVDEQSLHPSSWKGNSEQVTPPLWHHFDPADAIASFLGWAPGGNFPEGMEQLEAEETETQLLTALHRLLWGREAIAAAVPYRKPSWDQHYIRVLEYMHAHYTEPLNIDMLASIAMQSRFHFIRTFKTAMGVTPYQYVLKLRVEKAKDILQRTDITVTELSYRLGFPSTSQFFRAFVKFVKVTPEQYRMSTL